MTPKAACELSARPTRGVDAFQSLEQLEMVAERSNWRFFLAFGRTRLVGCCWKHDHRTLRGERRRYIVFQMAEVAIPRQMFQEICG